MISRKTLALAASSALAILAAAGGALGDSNRATVDQSGDANFAYVNQRGVDNRSTVTQTGDGNRIGSSYSPGKWDAYQSGNNNKLTITQLGNGNIIGYETSISYSASGYNGANFSNGYALYEPIPDYKKTIASTAGYRSLRNIGVDQIGDYNELTLTQVEGSASSNGNKIGTLKQVAAVGATNKTNILKIVQDNGDGSPGSATPYPASTQYLDDAYNYIGDIHQENTGTGAPGDRNTITIGQHTNHRYGYGQSNRADILTQIGTGSALVISQIGLRNIVTYVTQTGIGGGAGSDNSVTISQTGGDQNWVGNASQQGTQNTVIIAQTGMSNEIETLAQTGTRNRAEITQNGVGNQLVSLIQNNDGTGTSLGNRAILDFGGDDNGVGDFTGAALSVALDVATVSQIGDNNLLTYEVTSDGNLFAFSQDGSGNTITGSTSGGDVNQVAIKQVGNANGAHFTQIGGGNNLAIVQ